MEDKLLNKKVLSDIFSLHPLKKSFVYAFKGIAYMFLHHRNMRIIFISGVLVVILGLYLGVNRIELTVLCVTISVVFIAEMFNTAIELVIDIFTDKYHILLKIVKDISAGVVLIACLNALAVGYLLFFKKIIFFLR